MEHINTVPISSLYAEFIVFYCRIVRICFVALVAKKNLLQIC